VFKTPLFGAALLALSLPAFAEGIEVHDAYARSAMPGGPSGAAFMIIRNTGAEDDRLIAAQSDVAARVELHTHKEIADGVMRMMEVEEGFPVPAGGAHVLARGGDHVMFMGLNQALDQGSTVDVTLVFEKAGAVPVQITVDHDRRPAQGTGHGGAMMGHGAGHMGGMGN